MVLRIVGTLLLAACPWLPILQVRLTGDWDPRRLVGYYSMRKTAGACVTGESWMEDQVGEAVRIEVRKAAPPTARFAAYVVAALVVVLSVARKPRAMRWCVLVWLLCVGASAFALFGSLDDLGRDGVDWWMRGRWQLRVGLSAWGWGAAVGGALAHLFASLRDRRRPAPASPAPVFE